MAESKSKGISNNSPRQDAASGWVREFEQLRTIRYNWESYWADCARHILPNQNVFMRTLLYGTPQAERRTEFIFDSTATLALDRFAAAMESMLFPRTQKWHKLVPISPQLAENRAVRTYLEQVTEIMFASRYSTRANFASQAHEGMLGLGAFGTAGLFIDEDMGASLRYRQINLQDLYIAEDHSGLIRTVYRQFLLSAVNAIEQFGAENLPEAIVAAAANPAMTQREYPFLHGVRPRKDASWGRKDSKGMAFESCYIALDAKSMIEEGGYRVMPYAVSRYTVGPREVYGRSPGMTSLADIKMLSEMSKTDIEASHMAVRPPLLVPDDDMRGWNLRPGALNYGGMVQAGDGKMMPAVMALNSGINVEIAEEKMEARRKIINDTFLVTLFQILTESPEMTATEALLRAQEKGALLTPTMGRQQSEFLGPLIQRELDLLAHAGQLPPMPEELLQMGGAIKVEYSSPLNRLQRAEEGVGIMNTISQLAPMAEAGHPEVFDFLDFNKVGKKLFEINGGPADLVLDDDHIAQIQQQRQQQANQQALMEAAPQAASAAKDLMTARATALNSPSPQPGVGAAAP
jgi:hypothetical protein